MMAIAVAAMSFTACSNDLTEDVTPSQEITVQINAVENLSRTHFGDLNEGKYPTLWDATDKVKVALNYATAKNSTNTEVSTDGTTAVFTADLSAETTAPYTVYAVSPAEVVNSTYINNSYNSWTLTIPANQTPTTTSCDPAAQVLVGQSAASETRPTSVDIAFSHLTAYAKINFTNVALGTATVNSVTITADQDIAGKFYYYVADNTHGDTAGSVEANGAVKSITITTSELNNVWVALAPTAVSELTFTINTDQGPIIKEVTSLNKEFKSGVVATFNVDMAGKTIEKADKYTLVTDLSVLAEGDNVIIAAAEDNKALSTTWTSNNNTPTDITKNENTIIPTSSVEILTVEDAGINLYKFKNSEDKYIYAPGTGNHLKLTETLGDNRYWDITVDSSTGAAVVVAQTSATQKYLQYNSDNGLFSCYANTQKAVALYYKSNGGAKIAIEPQIIPAKTAINLAATDTYAEVGLTLRGITEDVDTNWTAEWIDDAEVTDNTLYITVLENKTSEAREGSITLMGGSVETTITVSQLGKVAGSVYTLTNGEICSWLTANGINTSSYVDASIESESGTWTANMSGNKSNTFLQIRKEKKSFAKTPVFDKPIKSITFKLNSKQTAGKYIYVIPANTELITDAYTTSNILATNYGSATTAAGEQTIVIELTDKTQNQVMIVASGSTIYINEISVTCAE